MDLTRLTATRGAHRGQLTKLLKKAEETMEKFEDPPALAQLQTMKALYQTMETKFGLLKDLDGQIIGKTDVENLEEAIINSDDHLSEFFINILKFKQFETPENLPNNQQRTSTPIQRRVNLPKLTLQKFDGNRLKWIQFIDTFRSAVDADDSLEDVQRFQYLIAQLTGEAARTIEGLPLTNANYREALDLLEKRYGQPHKLISTYMKALWELPKPANNIASVKDFYDSMEVYIRGLRSLGKTEDTYGDLLVPIVLEKLPGHVIQQISREHGDNAWTINELKYCLFKEIQAAEAGGNVQSNLDYNNSFNPNCISSTATLHVYNRSSKPKSTYTKYCAFCKGNSHHSFDCAVVTDVAKRVEVVKRDRLCYNCLKPKHRVSECHSKGRCRTCSNKHNTALCDKSVKTKAPVKEAVAETSTTTSSSKPTPATHITLTPTSSPVLLKTAVATVNSQTGSSQVNILFDEGAQRSFITQQIADKLGVEKGPSEMINLAAFGSNNTRAQNMKLATINLQTQQGPIGLNTLIVPKISIPVKNYVNSAISNHAYLKNLKLAQPVVGDTFEIDLLIGADYYWSIIDNDIVRGPGPTAVASKLGYLLSGPTNINSVSAMTTYCLKVITNSYNSDEAKIAQYWDLETIGIKAENEIDPNNRDFFERYRDENIKRDSDGHYTASLPWKSDHPPLPTNYNICNARTRSMVRKLTPEILNTYNNIIVDQLSRDFIEEVKQDDSIEGHYLPHHSVKKDSITTPIRVVYDCSCKRSDHPSLNDCLEVGPPLINNLVELLVRFRVNNIAFTSDIEKAFLNVRLDERDRNYTKFLWLSDPNDPESNFKVYRFKSVLFGSASSPFILNSVVKTHLESETCPIIANDLKDNIYVDNVITGINDTFDTNSNKAIEYYTNANDMMARGGFALRSWATNDPQFNEVILKDGNGDSRNVVNILGLMWDTNTDQLTYAKLPDNRKPTVNTKRAVVKITSSLFDPMGLLAPVHVQSKIFIQSLWQSNLKWDDPLSETQTKEWIDIRQQLDSSRDTIINRRYFNDKSFSSDNSDCELHVFSDASTKAYGAVAYLKHNDEISIVMAKTRVKPLKDMTLPRLELMGTLIATRLCKFLSDAFTNVNITKMVLWCDSQITIHWIKGNKKLPIFVENRVKEIRKGKFTEIMYCPTNDNPADLLTRGISANDLTHSNLWWQGPAWLPKGDWPVSNIFDSTILTCIASTGNDEHTCVNLSDPNHTSILNVTPRNRSSVQSVINIERYSSLNKLLRITALVYRFISNLKLKKHKLSGNLTTQELFDAKQKWVNAVQSEMYGQEKSTMQKKRRKPCTLINQLKLFIDDKDTIRCGGRFQNSNMKFEEKFPILLPNKHAFTNLVIHDAHKRILHSGVESTVTHIRQIYWIPKIRQVVRSILRKCVPCINVMGKAYASPETPPLPACRIKESQPFSVIGVDFSGAIYYKNSHSKFNKAYLCLFTCAVTRGVHLEVVTDMTVGAFIRAFRRFTSRRGVPTQIISDNATTFVAAAEDVNTIVNDPLVLNHLVNKNIKWSFIPKRAPWFGGFYERLIGITKNVLKKVLGHSCVTLDELSTLISEVEAVVNDRPITYVTTDSDEITPLTPSHLINGRLLTPLPHSSLVEDLIDDPDFVLTTKSQIDKRKQYLDQLFANFWKRWRYEYLPTLREDHQNNAKMKDKINRIKVGDVVHVHADNEKRINWRLGIIKELNFGNDGLVRSAVVKTNYGITNRPITKLYPLEVTSEIYSHPDTEGDKSTNTQETVKSRPIREAARQARDKLKLML